MTEPSRAPEPLKPCPFCGCEAITREYNRNWIAQCGMCNVAFAEAREANPMSKPRPTCFARTSGYPTEAEAIAAWNRRSATPASPAGEHPMQQVVLDDAGVRRFRANAIVRYLLDSGGSDMNKLARMPFSDADRRQFAQLIGYSVGGYEELSYALSLSPSSPREPSEAAVLSKHARDRLEEIAARAYRDDVAATVVLSPMEAYAILRAIDMKGA